jgi:DNA-directed RNA polymerase subunit D
MKSVFQNARNVRENTIQFTLAPTHVAYANTLRRLCMTSVESVGFRADIRDNGATTDVEILANSTPMTNEMLAHRVGLIPLYVKTPTEWDPEKYTFILDKTNETEQTMDIFASDFQVLEKRGEDTIQIPSSTFFRAHPKSGETCLLAVLKPLMPGGKPEEIRIKAKASAGIGRENARFIPTAQCAYSYTRDEDPEHQKQVFEDWIRRAKMIDPAELEKDAVKKGEFVREFNTLEVNRCYLKNEGGEPYSFDFTVESVGVLDPAQIVLRACERGADLCKRYAVDNLPGDVTVQRVEGQLLGWDFIFQGQDHTLGHLVQAWIDEHLINTGEVNFAGYDIPHPLRDEMVIRIGVPDAETDQSARRAIQKAMVACEAMFQTWRSQWAALVQPAAAVATSAPTGEPGSTAVKRRIVRKPVPTQ